MNHMYFVVALPLFLGGCAATSLNEVTSYEDPANPSLGVVPVRYSNPVAGYSHRVPVDPKPWRNQNDAQGPQGEAS
ncbi:hypothetical protein GOC53_28140 [Sinorhizobium medicae]|nr:hypothetical protein [Sinorhizobium medicae]MDX0532998.1 hypothetical protein [Sinorhizobium medicae]MDX0998836.1 hypothetical protein [Sinorhizobium medicae]MDX1182781.1 hypothetical protein [Sinorhizobium medicae]